MTLHTYALPRRMARRCLASAGRTQGAALAVNVRDAVAACVLTAAVPALKTDDLRMTAFSDAMRVARESQLARASVCCASCPAAPFAASCAGRRQLWLKRWRQGSQTVC